MARSTFEFSFIALYFEFVAVKFKREMPVMHVVLELENTRNSHNMMYTVLAHINLVDCWFSKKLLVSPNSLFVGTFVELALSDCNHHS